MVVTVTVAGGSVGVTEAGETEQVAAVGAPLQARATEPVNPPVGLTLTVYVVDWPAVIVRDAGEPESEKSPAVVVPVPERDTECGLPGASLVMLKAPLRAPATVGVNVTLSVHSALDAKLAGSVPQVFIWPKSPVIPMAEIVSGAVPVFFSVTARGALVVLTA